jgi:hypothetical protein
VEYTCTSVSNWLSECHIHDNRWTDTSRMKLQAITQNDNYPHWRCAAKYGYQTGKITFIFKLFKKLSYFIRNCGRGVRSWSRHCTTRREDLGSIPGRVLGNFKVTYSLCRYSVLLGYTQPVTNEYEGISFGVKCGRRVELIICRPGCAEYQSGVGVWFFITGYRSALLSSSFSSQIVDNIL